MIKGLGFRLDFSVAVIAGTLLGIPITVALQADVRNFIDLVLDVRTSVWEGIDTFDTRWVYP